METATPGKFQDFQEKIFPIVEYLTSKPEHVNHSFSKKWMVLKRTPNVPMTATITWRNLTILLGIRDMFQYREFLVQCPEFTKVVRFQNSKITRSGFDFGIDPTFHLPVFSPELPSSVDFPKPSESDDKSYVFDVDVPLEASDVHTVANDEKLQESQFIGVPNDISTTPRQTNVTASRSVLPAEDTDGSITSDGMTDVQSLKDSTDGE